MSIPHIRRVIDGMSFDTHKARLIAMVDADDRSVAFCPDAERTGLFLTAKDRWFLAGSSGAFGRWGHCDRWGQRHGHGLKLIDAAEARRLLEQVDGPVEEFFEIEQG